MMNDFFYKDKLNLDNPMVKIALSMRDVMDMPTNSASYVRETSEIITAARKVKSGLKPIEIARLIAEKFSKQKELIMIIKKLEQIIKDNDGIFK